MDEVEAKTARLAHPGIDTTDDVPDQLPEQFVNENRLWGLLQKNHSIPNQSKSLRRQKVLFDELDSLLSDCVETDHRVLLIKYPDIPKHHRDLDILIVKGFDEIDRALRERGFSITGDGEPYKRGYSRDVDGVTVEFDVHTEVSWWGNTYLNNEDLWEDRTRRTVFDTTVLVPSLEDELVICAANAVFGEVRVNLFDLYTMWWLIDQGADVSAAHDIVSAYQWRSQFEYICGIIEGIHQGLFDVPLGLADQPADLVSVSSMPYRYPIQKILGMRIEKVLADSKTGGLKSGLHSMRGYALEILQLGIDYGIYLTGLPKHRMFNMRPFLSHPKR